MKRTDIKSCVANLLDDIEIAKIIKKRVIDRKDRVKLLTLEELKSRLKKRGKCIDNETTNQTSCYHKR